MDDAIIPIGAAHRSPEFPIIQANFPAPASAHPGATP